MAQKKKTITKYYTKYNRHEHCSAGEINSEPSQTIQGEETTIAEMLRMSARGELPPMALGAFHGTNVDINKPLPPTDIVELENEVNEIKALEALNTDRSSTAKGKAKSVSSGAENTTSDAVSIEETGASAPKESEAKL